MMDESFRCFRETLLHIQFEANQTLAANSVTIPSWQAVVEFLDNYSIVTVEDLRAAVMDQLSNFQREIRGSEYNYWRNFFDNNERVDENRCSEEIASRLAPVFARQGVAVNIERMTVNRNRCDITFTKTFQGRSISLFVEVKGQWHKDLCTAATEQLHKRYLCHPDAADQGVYLVLWFGRSEMVAGRRKHKFASAEDLGLHLSNELPDSLKGKIDVVVLDVSKPD
ncbi:MAG: hypothetical protein R3E66_12645 [bacterium]